MKIPSLNEKITEWYGLRRSPDMIADADLPTRAWIAEMGRTNLHFFSTVIIGRNLLTGPDRFHGEMCRYAERPTLEKGRLALVPRRSLKTTIFSIDATLQDLAKDPNSTTLIVTGSPQLCVDILAAIKEQIEENNVLRQCYPELQPDKEAKWTGKRIIVKRDYGIAEPSVSAMSYKGSPEGSHFDKICADDLDNFENTKTRYLAEEVTNKFRDLWSNLYTPRFLVPGTRYADYDTYQMIIDEMVPAGDMELLKLQIEYPDEPHPVYGQYLWEEMFPREKIDQKKRALKERFWAQYMNEPMPEELQKIKQSMFRYWEKLPEVTFYFGCDPASGEAFDDSIIDVGAIDKDGLIYHVQAVAAESVMDFYDKLFELNRVYHPMQVNIEKYGLAGKMLEQQLFAEMAKRREYMNIRYQGGSRIQKEHRIETVLQPLYAQSRILHAPGDRKSRDFEDQIVRLYRARKVDRADAWSYTVMACLQCGFQRASNPVAERIRRSKHGKGLSMAEIGQFSWQPELGEVRIW